MRVTIGSTGTPIECETIEVSGRTVVLRGKKEQRKPDAPLLLAYCLRDGETVRRVSEEVYEIAI